MFIPIHQLKSAHKPLVGNKAYRLGQLMRAGFNVPDGVVIPAKLCATLRSKPIVEWSFEVAQEIKQTLKHLTSGGQSVAVRSSAIAEDDVSLSYAGQFQTVLNVDNLQQCLSAIATVIQSASANHIALYEQYHQHEQNHHELAVIIQRMVPVDFSGVIFSQNLIFAHPHEMLIEAVAKNVEGVESGKHLSEQLIIDRETSRVKEHTAHNKVLVSQKSVKLLVKVATDIENLFQQPQDIEYVFHEQTVYVLQARPITHNGSKDPKIEDEFAPPTNSDLIWTCHNVQEAFPKVMTPFTMSMWQDFLNPALNRHHNTLRIKSKKEVTWLFGYFYYKVHANVSLSRRMTDRILGQDPDVIMRSYLGKVLPYPDKESAWIRWYYRLKSAPFVYYYTLRLPSIVAKLNARLDQVWDSLQQQDLTQYTNEELIEKHDVLMHEYAGDGVGYHITVFTLPTLAVKILTSLLKPICQENTNTVINQLLSGLTHIVSAQISERIWLLSRLIKKYNLNLEKPLDQSLPQEWLVQYQQFIHDYGHRGLHELVYEAPLWRDDPTALISMIQQQAQLPSDRSPILKTQKAKEKRLLLTAQLRRQMSILRRVVFDIVLAKAHQWTALREFSKSTEAKGLRVVDPIHREMIVRLKKFSLISDDSDIWYLTYSEVCDLLRGIAINHCDQRILRRRKTLSINQYLYLPEYFYGYPSLAKPRSIDVRATTLHGVGVNAGVVRAKARVINRLREADQMQPGEILVTHISDAAWTPLFTMAAGVVVDIGSVLSHSSIIAREFGLPAVINVKVATKMIQTGDIITVDGNKGIVLIERKTR